jgi:hypothetical protein
MKKISVVLTLLVTLSVLSLVQSQAAPEVKTMSNAQLVTLLFGVAGLEMPKGAEILSDAEIFEVQANMMAEKGVTLFVGARANAAVTYGLVANLVYDALIGHNNATAEVKINYLANAGYLPSGGVNDAMAYGEIIAALTLPELTKAVAEAYSPAFRGRARTGVLAAPANPAPETPASPVT